MDCSPTGEWGGLLEPCTPYSSTDEILAWQDPQMMISWSLIEVATGNIIDRIRTPLFMKMIGSSDNHVGSPGLPCWLRFYTDGTPRYDLTFKLGIYSLSINLRLKFLYNQSIIHRLSEQENRYFLNSIIFEGFDDKTWHRVDLNKDENYLVTLGDASGSWVQDKVVATEIYQNGNEPINAGK